MARIENETAERVNAGDGKQHNPVLGLGEHTMLEGFDLSGILDGLLQQIIDLITSLFDDLLGNLFGGGDAE